MTKQYMVGTLDDAPLLMLTVSGTEYLYDEATGHVYKDAKGLPQVKDHDVVEAVTAAAKEQ